MLALQVLQAAKGQKYEIDIYDEQKTQNSGHNMKYVHIRDLKIQKKTRNSGYNI